MTEKLKKVHMTIVFEYCETFWLLYKETDAIVCLRKSVIRMSLSECFQNFAIKRPFKKETRLQKCVQEMKCIL